MAHLSEQSREAGNRRIADDTVTLSERDRKFREFSLNGNMWKLIFVVCMPLALFQMLNQLFSVLDTMMASHISARSVSTVAYISQISSLLSAVGGALALGGGVLISKAYGAGDLDMVKKRVSTLYALCVASGAAIIAVIVPISPVVLRISRMPEEFMADGVRYFNLVMFGIVINFINGVYIAIERARGNSKRIFYLNIIVILIKLSLTALFVYVMHGGIDMIAVATILSNGFLFLAGLWFLRGKGENAFGFSFRSIEMRGGVFRPILILGFPVMVEKMAFSLGKILVNSMAVLYGALTVGAMGISNNIGGFTTNPQNGFQEGAASIISQNLGAGKPERALDCFNRLLWICLAIGAVFSGLSLHFLPQISALFAANDEEFRALISMIYSWEALGAIPLGANAAVMALLYGCGETRITLLINFSRVFVFRVPVLWFLQRFTGMDVAAVGVVMAVSNISVGITALLVGIWQVRRLCVQHQIHYALFGTCQRVMTD